MEKTAVSVMEPVIWEAIASFAMVIKTVQPVAVQEKSKGGTFI